MVRPCSHWADHPGPPPWSRILPPPYGTSLSGNTFMAIQLVFRISHGDQLEVSDDGLLPSSDRERTAFCDDPSGCAMR